MAGPTELSEFQLPPVLGAPVDVSNIEVMDMQVALHLSGQLHEQVKDLTPGTRISGVTIEGDTP